MYDEKGYKKQYIASLTEASEIWKNNNMRVFDEIEPGERAIGKDLAEMNIIEIEKTLAYMSFAKKEQIPPKLSVLYGYARYCENDYILLIDEKKAYNIMQRKNYRFITYEEMKQIEKEINQSFANGWMYNAVIFCLYYGFSSIKEFCELNKSDVDFENDLICFNSGRIMSMKNKPELKKYLKEVIEKNSEYSESFGSEAYKGFSEDSVFKVIRYREDGNLEDGFYTTLFTKTIKMINSIYSGKSFNRANIYESGLVYYMICDIKKNSKEIEDYIFAKHKSAETKFLADHGKQFGCMKNTTQLKKMLADYSWYIEMGCK